MHVVLGYWKIYDLISYHHYGALSNCCSQSNSLVNILSPQSEFRLETNAYPKTLMQDNSTLNSYVSTQCVEMHWWIHISL